MDNPLQGLNKRLNGRFEDLSLPDRLKEFVINSARDVVLDLLKSDALANWITEQINAAVAATGLELNFRDLKNKETTRQDVDNAVTAKINALAGTNFQSLRLINRAAIKSEVGRIAGEKMGLGDLSNVDGFRDAIGDQLVSAFEGGQSALFGGGVVQMIETQVVANWQELTTSAKSYGNPMNKAGPPRDAAHAAQRASNRKRQARYRASHYLKWVKLGEGGGGDTGNGREGLSGADAGNGKPSRDAGGYIRRGGNQE